MSTGSAQAPSATTPKPDQRPVQTDSVVYVAHPKEQKGPSGKVFRRWVEVMIRVRYVNHRQTPIYIEAGCGGPNRPRLQWKNGNDWQRLGTGWDEAKCSTHPLVVVWPDGTYDQPYKYRIMLPLTGERQDMAGPLRVLWKLGVPVDHGDLQDPSELRLLPEDELTSNEFKIVVK